MGPDLAGPWTVSVWPPATRSDAGTVLGRGFDVLGGIFLASFGACALLAWWFAVRGWSAKAQARMRGALTAGWIVGTIGFGVGFVGPILWAPGANQGPLLGIFVTGPLGFLVGLLAGWTAPGLFRPRSV